MTLVETGPVSRFRHCESVGMRDEGNSTTKTDSLVFAGCVSFRKGVTDGRKDVVWLRMEEFVLIARSTSDGRSGGEGEGGNCQGGGPNNGFVRVLC